MPTTRTSSRTSSRTHRKRETKHKFFLKKKGRGFLDSKVPAAPANVDNTQYLADKAEYIERLKAAFALNTQTLADLQVEILELEKKGVDGPYRRTRSKPKLPDHYTAADPKVAELANLLKERAYTKNALKWNESGFTKLEKGIGENYRELLRP
jgi:hypothetical protein